jgi:hypothetical protein
MDYEKILLYAIAAIAALFTVYKTQYLPWKQKRDDELLNHNIKASDDTREYYQNREANAFSQTLSINERLVQVLIDISDKKIEEINDRLDSHEKLFYQIQQHVARAQSAIETANRERVQVSEQQSDIDIELHTIKELLRAALSRNGER